MAQMRCLPWAAATAATKQDVRTPLTQLSAAAGHADERRPGRAVHLWRPLLRPAAGALRLRHAVQRFRQCARAARRSGGKAPSCHAECRNRKHSFWLRHAVHTNTASNTATLPACTSRTWFCSCTRFHQTSCLQSNCEWAEQVLESKQSTGFQLSALQPCTCLFSRRIECVPCMQAVGMIRRLKADVLSDLPPKRRSRVPILPDPSHLKVRQ